MLNLPIELVHEIVGYLGYAESLIIAKSSFNLYNTMYKTEYDKAVIRSKLGLHMCVKMDCVQGIKICLRNEDPSKDNNLLIYYASLFGKENAMKELLKDDRVNPGDSNNRALCAAAEFGNEVIVQDLLKDPRVSLSNNGNYTALDLAMTNRNVDVVKLILSDPRVDKSIINTEMIIYVINAKMDRLLPFVLSKSYGNDVDMVRVFRLAISRNRSRNGITTLAKFNRQDKIMKILLMDPRVSYLIKNDTNNFISLIGYDRELHYPEKLANLLNIEHKLLNYIKKND